MAKAKATCFISYCHADIDRDTLEKFEELLHEYCEDYIEFIRDVQNPPGSNWDKFMSVSASVDAAIVILTPQYKKRVMTKTGGVYEEFRQLYTRLIQTREARETSQFPVDTPIKSFALVPLIFGGTAAEAVPEEIARENYQDFTHFHVARDVHSHRIILADSIKSRFVPDIKKLFQRSTHRLLKTSPILNSPKTNILKPFS